MLGSKNVPRSAISASSASVTWLPCVTAKQPARAAARTASAACACTQVRLPAFLASSQAAWICSSLIVLAAALADALRGEELDQVGAARDELAHLVAHLLRRPDVLVERTRSRSAAAGPGSSARDGLAQLEVGRRADALHGREAGHQRDVRVLRRVEHPCGGSRHRWTRGRPCRSAT